MSNVDEKEILRFKGYLQAYLKSGEFKDIVNESMVATLEKFATYHGNVSVSSVQEAAVYMIRFLKTKQSSASDGEIDYA